MKREAKQPAHLSMEQLREKIARYEQILNVLPFPLCVSDKAEQVEFFNAAAQRFFAEDKDLLLACSAGELKEQLGMHFDQEADAMTFARGRRRFQLLEEKLLDANEPGGSVALIQEVMQQRGETEMLAALASDVPVGVFKIVLNEGFDILYANAAFYALHGCTNVQLQEEAGGKMLHSVYPDDRQYVQETLYGAVEAGRRSCSFEMRILQQGGGLRWTLAQGTFLSGSEGIVFCGYLTDSTEGKQAQETARVSEERWRIAFSLADGRMWEYDPAAQRIAQSKAAAACYGSREAGAGVPAAHIASGFVHPDSAEAYRRLYERLAAGDASCTWIGRLRGAAGQYVWTKLVFHAIFGGDGALVRAVGTLEDVKEAERARLLYQQELKYQGAVAWGSLLVCEIHLTRGEVIDGALSFLGCAVSDAPLAYGSFCARMAERMAEEADRTDFQRRMERGALLRVFAEGTRELRFECRMRRADGNLFWGGMRVHLMEALADGDLRAFIYLNDLDGKKQAEETAQRDALTQLYSRAAGKQKIEDCLASAQAQRGALLLVDVNNFRAINAAFGHAYGNGVLREIGARLRENCGEADVAARWGGDEFLVFLRSAESEATVRQRAARLCTLLQIDCEHDGQRYRTDVSVGAALAAQDGEDFAALCRQAEAALAQAKAQGKSCFVLESGRDAALPEQQRAYWEETWLWEDSGDAVYIVDMESYEFLYLNRAAKRMLGWKEADGRKCYELVYGADDPCTFCEACRQQDETSYIRRFRNAFLQRDFILQTKAVSWQGRLIRIEKAIDVSGAGCAAQLLAAKMQSEAALEDSLRALLQLEQFKAGAPHLLQNVALFYGADRAYVMEADRENACIRLVREWRAAQCEAWPEALSELPLDAERWLPLFQQREPLLLEREAGLRALHPRGYSLLCERGIESLCAAPYTKADGTCGLLGLNNPTRHRDDLTYLSLNASVIANEMQKGALLEKQDFMLYHDALTGAFNRAYYIRYLENCDGEKLRTLGVLAADINGLKQVNRNFGHVEGDQVVMRTAEILRCLFPEGKLFRVNGDEFVLLCENIAREPLLAGLQIAKRQMRMLRDGVTLGCTWADADIDAERLVEHAGELLLIEKRQYYKEADSSGKNHRPILVRNLKKALAAQEFQVYLQPKIGVQTGEIAGAEALVRRMHPRYGLLAPAKFVPMLERERIISYVDFFVFEKVCQTLERWRQKGVRLFPISLNFSRATILETDLMEQMEDIYKRYDIPAEMVEIEITESIGEMERETIADISKKIKTRGFSISLDDFGSKYTSMSMLSIMKFHVLKLDKSLVNNLVENAESRMVVRHVVDMCKDMRIKSVAEGVETAAQLEILRSIGCDYAQGYLFGKPIPLPEFERIYLHLPEEK